jgi:hypothetical protein
MRPHRGTCEITFAESNGEASGFYLNDHNRLTYGRIDLSKTLNGKDG